MRLLNYYMAEEIAIAPALVSSTVQIKNLTINWPVMSQSQWSDVLSHMINRLIVNFVWLQEKMLQMLNKKVEEVYRNCIGDNEANIR